MAKDNLKNCLPVTLKYEGGKADNPKDPGGRTNKGITQTTYRIWRKASGLVERDVYLIEDFEVNAIYQEDFWDKAGCESLVSGFDLQHFDGTVNSGLGESKKWLATAQAVKPSVGEAVATQEDKIQAYATARLHSLESFKTWITFGKGWSARVAGVEAAGIKMASGSIEPSLTAAYIAKAGATAATRAKVTSAVSHVSGAVASAATVAATTGHHPYVAAGIGLASIFSAIWGAFHSSVSGARAATLAQAAVS